MGSIEKEYFLDKYKLKNDYDENRIHWSVIEEITENYQSRKNDMEDVRRSIEELLKNEFLAEPPNEMCRDKKRRIHSIEGRVKNTEHLAEKIIRKTCIEDSHKYKEINADNYIDIIHDLIGIRILVLAKEGWEPVHNRLCQLFPAKKDKTEGKAYMAERPKAYIRYGDRDVFYNKIEKDYTNKGYRSQPMSFS